jgi:hypothetical protein
MDWRSGAGRAIYLPMTYKARKFWAAVVLVVGLPVYIAMAWWLTGLLDRPHFLVEAAIYLVLGVLWALPLKGLFKGIGREDPDKPSPPGG